MEYLSIIYLFGKFIKNIGLFLRVDQIIRICFPFQLIFWRQIKSGNFDKTKNFKPALLQFLPSIKRALGSHFEASCRDQADIFAYKSRPQLSMAILPLGPSHATFMVVVTQEEHRHHLLLRLMGWRRAAKKMSKLNILAETTIERCAATSAEGWAKN